MVYSVGTRMLYLKLVPNDFNNASHDKRELSVAKELGYKVRIFATTKKTENYREVSEGYEIWRISTRRFGQARWLTFLNRVASFLDFVIATGKTDADVISGHDYIATLAAYIANCFKRRKAKIIYDSHEFELYQNPNRNKFALWLVKCIEGFLLHRVDLALMVGDKIADGVQKIYGLKKRPVVVRNIPLEWQLEPEKAAIIRKQFLRLWELPENSFLLMYHGNIAPGHGIEWIIRSLPWLPKNICFVVMGNETMTDMIESLRALAKKAGVNDRIFFHPAVSFAALKNYIGAADVAMVLLEGKFCINHAYALPNKFFESIQACVPLICFDLPEIGQIVRHYGIGLLANEDDEKSVAEAVMKLRNDKALYDRLKRNMEKTKKELCWEKESLKLKAAIQGMMGKPTEKRL